MRIPMQKVNRTTRLTLDTVVYHCTSEESVCLVDPIRASVEVRPAADGAASAGLKISVRKP